MEPPDSKQPEPNPQKSSDAATGRHYRVNLTVDVVPGQAIRVTIKAPVKAPSDQTVGDISSASKLEVQSTESSANVIVPAASKLVEIQAAASQAAQPEPVIASQAFLEPRPAPRPLLERVKEWPIWGRTTTWVDSLPFRKALTLANILFGLAIFVYLLTHLIGLAKFPIYYSGDEASVTVYGADLVSNNLHDDYGELLPTFFQHDGRYNMGILVYIQALAFLVAGKSIFFSRLVIVLSSLVGAVWVSFILRDIFKLRHWWLGVMLLAATPGWFLFTRGVYDVSLMASLYAGFIYYYLLYRTRSPRYLYIALLLGALTFYAYPGGEIVMVVTGVMLFFSDIRYHWQQRKTALLGLGELVLLALPFVRFLIVHPGEYSLRVQQYASYWGQNISLVAKIGIFLQRALADLNPFYWFFPNSQDLPMYVMKGYGHLLWIMLPFVLIGLWVSIRKIRASEYRLLILALLAAPTSPALVTLVVYRAIAIVIPLILFTAVGFSAFLDWLEKRRPHWGSRLAYASLVLLIFFSFFMLRDSLVNGPTWYKDYGISGMQYGSSQVFSAARTYAQQHPAMQIYISPNWTFSSEVLRRFYVPDLTQIHMGTADAYMLNVTPGLENTMFVLIPSDLQKVASSGWFKDPQVDLTIPCPDGTPCFYFVRLQYQDNIDQIVAAQKALLNRLVEGDITLNGEKVHVRYSLLDSGPIDNAFDGNLNTLVKSGGANPLVIELEFPTPRQLTSLTARVGSEPVKVTVTLTGDGDVPLGTFSQEAGASGFKDVTVDFSGLKAVTKLHFELLDPLAPNPSNVHVWEITLH